MKTTIAILCLLSLAAAPAKAATRTWTDAAGKRSIVAELVESTAGTVRLQKADGKTIVLPLDRLSESDRQYVEMQTRGPETPKKTPAEWLAELKIQAQVQWDDAVQLAADGGPGPRDLNVILEVTGPAASQASAMGLVKITKATDSQDRPLSLKDADGTPDDLQRVMVTVDRTDTLFARHPAGGLRVPLVFAHPAEIGDRLAALEGTLQLRTGGRRGVVVEEKVGAQTAKAVQDSLLKEAGLEVRFRVQSKAILVVDVRGKMDRLAGVSLTDSGSRPIDAATSRTLGDSQGQFQFDCQGTIPASGQLRIALHLDAEMLEVPLLLKDLRVPAQSPPIDFLLKAEAR